MKPQETPKTEKEQAQQLLENLRSMLRGTKDKHEKDQLRKQIEGLVKFINREEGKEIYGDLDVTKLKDITNLEKGTSDVYRNFRKVFGQHYDQVKKTILHPLDEAKKRICRHARILAKQAAKRSCGAVRN
ncbi:hypothetical protein DI43_05805 [Geobacillus sp. CAMR12739]|nr:hypothetical protein DI43_05805 [Geobacillus sp. CAMR12739]